MAIINSYPRIKDLQLTDMLLGTNADNRTVNFMISDVISYINEQAGNVVLIGSPANGLNLDGVVLTLGLASSSSTGALSSSNWSTFNNKQNALSGNGIVKATGSTISYITDGSTNWNTAYNNSITGVSVTGTTQKLLTLTRQNNTPLTTSWDEDASITIGTPANGLSISEKVLSLALSNSSITGALNSADWINFNNAYIDTITSAAVTTNGTEKTLSLNQRSGMSITASWTDNGTILDGIGFVKANGTTISYDASTYVPTTRNITTTTPLQGGGNLNGDLALTIRQANSTGPGYVSTIDWNKFNTAYLGTITSAAVTSNGTEKTLSLNQESGMSITASWTDEGGTVIDGTGFVKANGTVVSYDNSTYVPTSRTITINGESQNLSGNVSFTVAGGVTSVFTRTGAVVAQTGDYTTTQVTEGTNLYYTNARVSANTDVFANTAARHNAVTIGTANGLSLSTQQLSLSLASSGTTGALSSTDWNTFNGKQTALSGTGFIKASGSTISYDNSTYALDSAVVKLTGDQSIAGVKSFTNNISVTGTITASGGFFNSDIRLKDVVSRNGDVIVFKWKDGRDSKTHVGYSAQEVQAIMPDAVSEGEDGILSVNYIEILVAKIAELENRIKQLEK